MNARFVFLTTVNFWIYVAKCLVGLAICYAFNVAFPDQRLYWSIISVLLVISPDDMESRSLPISRIKANIIGSLIGLACFVLPIGAFLAMIAGVVLTIIICFIFNLGAATRSALAALIIVLVQEVSDQQTQSAFQRMISVILGCLVALFISIACEKICKIGKKK